MKVALDQLARLLVLEGAFQNSWPKGLGAARKELGDQVPAVWTDPRNSGMYNYLLRKVAKELTRKPSLSEADDVLQNALAGLNVDGHLGKNIFRMAGVQAAQRIRNGVTPLTLARSNLCLWIWRKAQNESKGSRKPCSLEQDSILMNPCRHSDLGELFVEAVLDQRDPVGQHIRNLLLSTTGDYHNCLVYLLGHLKKTDKLPRLSEISKSLGIHPQTAWKQMNLIRKWTPSLISQDGFLQDALEFRLQK